MKETTKQMLDQVDAAHDWTRGQAWSSGGTRDGGPQLARVYKRESADVVARRYDGCIVGYGPTRTLER